MKRRVGFIGLGVMGRPMAKNLLAAGYPLTVHSRSRGPVQELEAAGARGATSAREVAENSEVIITCLPDSPDVELVATGPDGILEGAREGAIFIDTSTISPVVTRRIAGQAAARGVQMLDAPISGGEEGAIKGTLSIMVGGDRAAFESCQDIFQVLGKNVVHAGESGMGQIVKACNQIVVAMNLQAVAEALVLAQKAGADPQKVIAALSGGAARSWILEARGPWMVQKHFQPGFRINLHYKDLGIVMDSAREFGVSLPGAALAHELFGALKAQGRGDLDHSAIVTLIAALAGLE
jgi:2-hydroxy-3-oxopropionate reductase